MALDPGSSGVCGWAHDDGWAQAWDPLVAAIGVELEPGPVRPAADPIDGPSVRRYLEPLEFECPLHYDADVARAHGYAGVLAPYSALVTWTTEALWSPGDPPLWTDASIDSSPPPRGRVFPPPAPPTDAVFQTNLDHVFSRPLIVEDHLSTVGRRVLDCRPKQTSVGRGAFVTWEVRVLDQRGQAVALIRPTAYFYVAGAGHGSES